MSGMRYIGPRNRIAVAPRRRRITSSAIMPRRFHCRAIAVIGVAGPSCLRYGQLPDLRRITRVKRRRFADARRAARDFDSRGFAAPSMPVAARGFKRSIGHFDSEIFWRAISAARHTGAR